jgi:hypothetical protein
MTDKNAKRTRTHIDTAFICAAVTGAAAAVVCATKAIVEHYTDPQVQFERFKEMEERMQKIDPKQRTIIKK